MKKTLFISTICLLFFAQNLMAQDEDLDDEDDDETEDVVTPTPTSNQRPKETFFIQLRHSGAYVAKYELLYNEGGVEKKIETGNKTAGFKETFYFPPNATNIRLKGWAMTGLVWYPWGEIYNKILQPSDLNKCYRNTGTTLNRNWDNNCKD